MSCISSPGRYARCWRASGAAALRRHTGSLIGVRIRNRIDAQAFRVWVKRALFVIALVLLGQYFHAVLA